MAAVSTATVVGWAVSPILRKMFSLVESYVSSQYSWKSNMVSDLKNLQATLTEVLLVVDEAEKRHLKDRNQVGLLCQMREAVCDAEDMLDKFDYKLIRETVEHQSMARSIVASSLSLGKRLVGLDKMRSELHIVIKSMARVRSCADMLARFMTAESTNSIKPPDCVQNRATGYFLCEDTIFGRKEEVDELVSWLLNGRSINSSNDEGSFTTELHSIHSKKNIELHSIVGVGGIGKTTVAQSIYNDKRILDTFDTRMWVYVSHNFDKINLIKEIIAHASGGKNIKLTHFNFSMLQEELQRRISNKKFLLVLDDVWYDENCGEHGNRERWRELIAPMENAAAGSKILVTTRMELVAKVLDCNRSFLHGLGEDDSWSLFRDCHNCFISSSTLESIEMQIVRKLNGSPLALKVIGRHLHGRHKVAEWDEVLHSNILDSDDMLTILRSSYEGLPIHLQRCFSYCSLFPKGYHIDPEKLIHMWIAQGFVDTKGSTNKSLKDSGRSYFDELLARSFFQMLTRGNKTFYVMHDIMSDLALHVSQGECLRVECESMEEMPLYIQHLSIYGENLENLLNHDLSKLRSLIVLSNSWFCSKICLDHAILGKLKSVRVLDITGCCLEQLPDAVNRLIHLRYLGIHRTFHPLPRKMLMYHLQALFVQYHSCYSPREYGSSSLQDAKTVGGHFHLPESINKLVNLVHVDVERAYVLMLSNTLKLPFVECAGEFHVNEEGSLLALKDLNKIQGQLTLMSLDKVQNKVEASEAHLHHKKHIIKLELQWGSLNCASSTKQGFEVLDALKPHSDLEELTISGYPGARSPSWLESGWLSRLQFICLRDCNRWEVLPPLGDLSLLKTIEIRRMQKLKTLGQEFFGCAGFPSLERLILERLPELEWCLVDNEQVFHNLRHLSVAGCPKLREYPTYARTLEHIAILDREWIQMKIFVPSARISGTFCILVSSFFHILHAHHLEFVEDMEIYVNNGVCMSRELLENLKSLKKLRIFGIDRANTCSVITTLWDENGSAVFPSPLRSLELVQCYLKPSFFSKQLNNLSSLDTLSLIDCDTIEMPCPPVSMWHLRMLKRLCLCKCDWITSFEGSEALVSLEEMSIYQCYDLEYVPDLNDMPSLEKLHLGRCPQVMRLSSASYQTRLKELVIESCDGLASLRELQGLVSLTKLQVTRCSELELLPDMDSFYALGVLIIKHCSLLRSLPKSGLPVSLRTFVLDGCHQALEEQFQRGEGLDWNKVAALPGCMRSTSEPEEEVNLARSSRSYMMEICWREWAAARTVYTS